MQAIEDAFNESVSIRTPQPKNEWWGYRCKGNNIIMRYDKIAIVFNEVEEPDLLVSVNKTNKLLIAHAQELIKAWQTENKVTLDYSSTSLYPTC
jgi:hypothetical protein